MTFNDFYKFIETQYKLFDDVELYFNALHTSITVEYKFNNKLHYATYSMTTDDEWVLIDRDEI